MARISFCTFGCKVNQYESEKAVQTALAAGHEVVPFGDEADVQIVHTCSVTKAAVRDGRQALRRAGKNYPDSLVIATGCAARTDSDELLPSKDVRLIDELAEAVSLCFESSALPEDPVAPVGIAAQVAQSRTRALLKIHDGCYFRCAFCIVPNARPVESSKPVDEVVEEAKDYVALGHKEIVLTGVRITGYRPETYLRRGLVELINRLGGIDGLERVRLTSLYPSEVRKDLLTAIRDSPNACPHLHLALQSGDDEILRRMRRHYTSREFEDVVAAARELMPDVAITTDVIAGFPGETDEAFQNTRSLMERVKFSKAHIFTYSPRPGTPGADMPDQVPSAVAKARTKELIALSDATGRGFRQNLVGSVQRIIVERQKKTGVWFGLTPTYVETSFEYGEDLRGRVVDVYIEGAVCAGLKGRLVEIVG